MTTNDQLIVGGWLRSGSEFSDTAYEYVKRMAHRSLFPGLRLPMYAVRLPLMSPRGLFRTLRAIWRLVFDHESQALRLEHRDRGETPEYVKLRRDARRAGEDPSDRRQCALRSAGRRRIGRLVAIPEWVLWLVAGCAVLVFGGIGRPIGKPLAKPATLVDGRFRRCRRRS